MAKKLRWVFVLLMLIARPFLVYAQNEDVAVQETETEETQEDVTQEQATDETEEPASDVAQETQTEETQEDVTQEQAADDTQEPAPDVQEDQAQDDQAEPAETPAEPQEEPEEQPTEPDQAPQEQPTLGEDEVMGIDTVDIADPQGNWLYKRVWWERAEAKFEKIREVVNKVLEVRTDFFAKRAELDKNVLDPFYLKIGISQGELQETIKDLITKVEKLIATAQTDEIRQAAEKDKRELEQLQQKIDKVVSLDTELDNAVNMLVEQISKIRSIEQQAWQDFKSIARVLDDRKARELFYKVDTGWRNIKDLQQYIQDKFSTSFDQIISKVKEQIEKAQQEMNAIKESGTDLHKRLLSAEKAQEEMEDQEQEEEEPSEGFVTRWIANPVTRFFTTIWNIITWPYYKIVGAPDEDDEYDEEDEGEMESEQGVTQEETAASAEPKPEQVEQPEQIQQEPEAEQAEEAMDQDEPDTPPEQEPVDDQPELDKGIQQEGEDEDPDTQEAPDTENEPSELPDAQ